METIIRVHKDLDADPFARIDKIPINDPTISYKAKGILVYVLSKPDGWEINITDLSNHAVDAERSIRSGIQELLTMKYSQRVKVVHPETKRIKKWIYLFYERPYDGDTKELLTVEDPDCHNVNMGQDPDCCFPHVDNPQVENPHVDNVPPNNKVFKQLSIKSTKEGNNNNNGKGSAKIQKDIIIVSQKIKYKRKFNKLKDKIQLMGWVGPMDEIVKFHNENPKRVEAWVEYIYGIQIKNRAGLLRKSLRSGESLKTKADQEDADRKGYLTDKYAEAIES